MANIVIKKRISLDFLGTDYEGGFVEFRSLSVKDMQENLEQITNVGDDNKKAISLTLELLSEQFVGGVFKTKDSEETIEKKDLADFPADAIIKFFQILSGQDGDLKA